MAFDKHKELEHFFKALEPLNETSKTIAGQLLISLRRGRHDRPDLPGIALFFWTAI